MAIAGRAGSGLSGRMAAKLKSMLIARDDPAVDGVPSPINRRRLHWVEPEVVVEIEFLNWTDDGRLRNPVFRGIRADKEISEARGDA